MQSTSRGAPHYQNRIYSEHTKGIIHNIVYGMEFFWIVGDEVVQGTFWVEVIEVDGGVDHMVIESG